MKQSPKTDVEGYDWFQRKFKGIEVGDVFSVPLPSGGYAFGRVYNAHDGATLAEFFKYWKQTPEFDAEILESGRLFPPTGFLITDIAYRNRKRSWKVIHKDTDFYPDDLYELKFSQCGDGVNWTYFTLYDHWKTLGRVSLENVDQWNITSRLPQHPDRITDVIEIKLKEHGITPS